MLIRSNTPSDYPSVNQTAQALDQLKPFKMPFPTAYITPITIANNDSDSDTENYRTLATEIDNTSYIEAALLCEGHS
jgi:hypothetical protein